MLESPFKYPIWSRKVIIVGYRALQRFCTKLFFAPSTASMRTIEPPEKLQMAVRGPQNGRRGLESGLPQVFGRSHQLSLNNFFFYPSPPSMRNEEAPAKIKKASKGPQNGRRGVERGLILGYWVLQTTSAKLFFFI